MGRGAVAATAVAWRRSYVPTRSQPSVELRRPRRRSPVPARAMREPWPEWQRSAVTSGSASPTWSSS
jgi:hypothetical protein